LSDWKFASKVSRLKYSPCGRRLNIQTPKSCATYYRENSHHRGYHDCLYIGQSVRAETIDEQIADLIRSIRLPENWEPIVRKMLNEQRDRVDPETERKEIRGTLRLMRENFERGLYESPTGLRTALLYPGRIAPGCR
jgi:hypothetical protein